MLPSFTKTGMCALLLGASCLNVPGHASEAAPLTSGAVTISDLRYKLVDLDPDDGMTPYLLMTRQEGRASLGTNDGDPFEIKRSVLGPFDGGDISLSNAQGTALAGLTPGVLRAEGRLLEGEEQNIKPNFFGGRSNSLDAFAGYDASFELSPNTTLVLEGTVSVASSTALEPLKDNPLLQPGAAYRNGITGYHSAIAHIQIDWSEDLRVTRQIQTGQTVTALGVAPYVGWDDVYPTAGEELLPFSLTLRNGGLSATGHTLWMYASSYGWLSATPVPEASVPASVLAGGLGLLLAGRLRRRAAWSAARHDTCRVARAGVCQAWAVSCLALGTASSAIAASGAVIAEGSARLTALSYALTDLDPDDGIAPSITFGPYPYTRLMVEETYPYAGNREVRFFPGGLGAGGTQEVAHPAGRGKAVRDESGMRAEVIVHMSDAMRYEGSFFDDLANTWYARAGLEGSPFNAWQFTLSSNTAVTFTGRSTGDFAIDLDELVASELLQGAEAPFTQIKVGLFGDLKATVLRKSSQSFWPRYDEVVADVSRSMALRATADASGWWLTPDDRSWVSNGSQDFTWSLAFENTEADPMAGALSLGADVGVRVSAVPEPGIFVLVLSGLCAAGLAQRRRRVITGPGATGSGVETG